MGRELSRKSRINYGDKTVVGSITTFIICSGSGRKIIAACRSGQINGTIRGYLDRFRSGVEKGGMAEQVKIRS